MIIPVQRSKQSEYMKWSKTCSQARFNLSASDITKVAMSEFPRMPDQFEITGPGGYGYLPLQQAIATHTGIPQECIVAATGASMANHVAMAAILNPGDEVLIEQPTYGFLLDVANYLQARIKRVPREFETGFALEQAEVEALLTRQTRLIVLSNLHNPSGALLDQKTLRAIGELAQGVGALVLVDEVYLEMLFDVPGRSAFAVGQELGRGNDNPFVITNSLTKAYGLSGLRCGWVIASPDLAKRMWRLNDLFGVNAPHVAELISVAAFDQLARFRDRARALLKDNRALLDQFLDSHPGLECFRPPGGTVVFPRLNNVNIEEFLTVLRDKYETSVVPGRFFEMPRHFRIGIGGPTDEVRGGLERLGAALDEV